MDLFEAFRGKNHGLGAYVALRKRCIDGMRPGVPDAALNKLIVGIIDEFIDYFEREPFPGDIADAAHANMVQILEAAAAYHGRPAEEKLAVLDAIAFRQLYVRE
jgi:hypothetical protein